MRILLLSLIFILFNDAHAIGSEEKGHVIPANFSERVIAHSNCRDIVNGSATKHYYVPTTTSTEFTSFLTNTPADLTVTTCATTYRSCLEIKRVNPSATSGKYTIDPDGTGGDAAFDTYCEMDTNGGGWTLVWSNTKGGTNKPVTNLSWVNATKGGSNCSQANGSGTGCATYLTNDRENFNYYIGIESWSKITQYQEFYDVFYQWAPNYAQPIAQAGKWTNQRMHESQLYKTGFSDFFHLVGTTDPGLILGHSNAYFSTIDLDNDGHLSSCPDFYSDTPFWYSICYNGSLSGHGQSGGTNRNAAYWVNSVDAPGATDGSGGGNGWLYVREYDYLKNCSEIKGRAPDSKSGNYWIDPDGPNGNAATLVFCDMENDGGGWTLVHNHNLAGGVFDDLNDASFYNINLPLNNKYSILSRLSDFRSRDGTFTFKLHYPELDTENIWRQATNPMDDVPVGGYEGIALVSTSEGWGGLEKSNYGGISNLNKSLMDGTVGSNNWWYAIGATSIFGGSGIPAYDGIGTPSDTVQHVQLYVKDTSFLVETPRDCQEILDKGISRQSGLYTIDSDGTGGNAPYEVYCDLENNGGGWTRVFKHNYTAGYFVPGTTALSSNTTDPDNDKYSILNKVEDFREDGRFIFKIEWPGRTTKNIWSQTTNPTVDQPVAGYVGINIGATSNYWGGLERNCTIGCGNAFIDGSVNHGNYYYAVGSINAWSGKLPAANDVDGGAVVDEVHLYVKRAKGYITKRSCKEILDAGLSTGTGYYLIDPDGTGGELPFKVLCDMTVDGGGWTRVAFSIGAIDATWVPDDFLANTYRKDVAAATQAPVTTAYSINPEQFSKLVGTTDALLVAPAFTNSPYQENGMGAWDYDTAKCTGTLRHTSRTAGCTGQNANDNFSGADQFNIAIESGNEGIVPTYNNAGNELCYNGKGDCTFHFYLR